MRCWKGRGSEGGREPAFAGRTGGRGISRSLKKLDLAFDFGGAAVHRRDNRLVLSAGFQPLRVTAVRRHEVFINLSAALEMLHCLPGGFCFRRTWAIWSGKETQSSTGERREKH